MAKKDPRIDAYIASSAGFARPILRHLRKVVHQGCPEVEETIKWNFPHFEYKGPMCGMAAFKNHCVFGFWKASLIFGEGEEAKRKALGDSHRITKLSDLASENKLLSFIKKAVELNDKGIKPPVEPRATRKKLQVPKYLTNALAKNAKARKTFENFSYSHRKEYIDWLTDAKRDETRAKRLATAVQWLAEGKPHNWRYMPARK